MSILSWKGVRIYHMLFLHLLRWSCDICFLLYWYDYTDWILDVNRNIAPLGINPTCSWCVNFICCWILFACISVIIFVSIFILDIGLLYVMNLIPAPLRKKALQLGPAGRKGLVFLAAAAGGGVSVCWAGKKEEESNLCSNTTDSSLCYQVFMNRWSFIQCSWDHFQRH